MQWEALAHGGAAWLSSFVTSLDGTLSAKAAVGVISQACAISLDPVPTGSQLSLATTDAEESVIACETCHELLRLSDLAPSKDEESTEKGASPARNDVAVLLTELDKQAHAGHQPKLLH